MYDHNKWLKNAYDYLLISFYNFVLVLFTNRVVMNCVYYGDFRVKHFKKRRLIGSPKKRALDAMCSHKVDPSVFEIGRAHV